MLLRMISVTVGVTLISSSGMAQGIFLDKGKSALIVDFAASGAEDIFLFGLSGGFSAGGIMDIGLGGLFGGEGSGSIAGVNQFASIHLFRSDSPQGSRAALSLVQSMVYLGAPGSDGETTMSVGGRASFLSGRSGTVLGPVLGYDRLGLMSARPDVDSYVFGAAIAMFHSNTVVVITPAVSVARDETAFSVSLTLNFLGAGRKWRDGELVK